MKTVPPGCPDEDEGKGAGEEEGEIRPPADLPE